MAEGFRHIPEDTYLGDLTADQESAENMEFGLAPEIEKKLLDLKYMIDHWHDPNEIIDPERSFTGVRGEEFSEKLGTENILEGRPVYFHETHWRAIQSIVKKGIHSGSIGIAPFFWGSFLEDGNRDKPKSFSEDDLKNIYDDLINNKEEMSEPFSKLHMCLLISGDEAKRVSDTAKNFRELKGDSYKRSYAWRYGEISNMMWHKNAAVKLDNIIPDGIILGIAIPLTEQLNRAASLMGERTDMPIFDLRGNLLWPQHMSYNALRRFTTEREKQRQSGGE